MRRASRWFAVGIAALFVACGSSNDPGSGSDGGKGDASFIDDTSDPGFGDTGPVDGSNGSDGGKCPANAQMVYVTGVGAQLWSFWPPTFSFKLIGTLSCTTSPTHMTVDRNGVAWVVASGNIYKTSTVDATCSALSTWKPQSGFSDFALSFIGLTNSDTSLYLLGSTNLARFDIASGNFATVGSPGVNTYGDMTTNGDGTLYYLRNAATLNLYEFNPATAAVMKTYGINTTGGGNQALAYFGGRFYAFVNNVVHEYDPVANTVKTVGTAPLSVTGAGQSTCVPSEPTDAVAPN